MASYVYKMSEDSDFLMHHGIKGQKWGVENGPPYPLDPKKDYTAAEKKANAKKIVKEYRKNLSSKTIDDIDITNLNIDDVDSYIDNLIGKYGNMPVSKTLKYNDSLYSRIRHDIRRNIRNAQSKYTENECQEIISKNGFNKIDDGGGFISYKKEINDYNPKSKLKIRIAQDGFDTSDINGLKNTINLISKDFKSYDSKIRKAMADKIIDDYKDKPWDDKYEKMSSNELKKEIISKLGDSGYSNSKGYINVRIIDPNYIMVGYDDGGLYGYHYISAEYDMKNDKINDLSFDG